MEAHQGFRVFFGRLLASGKMTAEQLKTAIRIAATKAPSAAFDAPTRSHEFLGLGVMEKMALQKGCRWLALIRRDEGDAAFNRACDELRAMARGGSHPGATAKPLAIAWRHVGRHFRGSGTLGATIDKWATPQEMLADPIIAEFLRQVVPRLDMSNQGTQFADLDYPGEVGFEGIVRLATLPIGSRVWPEEREGYTVNVTNARAPRCRRLRFLFAQKPDAWLLLSVWCGTTESRPLSDTAWWRDFAFYNLR